MSHSCTMLEFCLGLLASLSHNIFKNLLGVLYVCVDLPQCICSQWTTCGSRISPTIQVLRIRLRSAGLIEIAESSSHLPIFSTHSLGEHLWRLFGQQTHRQRSSSSENLHSHWEHWTGQMFIMCVEKPINLETRSPRTRMVVQNPSA